MIDMQMPGRNIVINHRRIKQQEKRASVRAVRRALAFIRTKARTRVLRRRKRVSSPGQPPSIHTRDPRNSLKNILFDFDPDSGSGVVGPILLSRSRRGAKASGTVPQTLESGGNVTYYEELLTNGDWVQESPKGKRKRSTRKRRTRRVIIKPRPFMFEALEQVQREGKVLLPWKDAVKAR